MSARWRQAGDEVFYHEDPKEGRVEITDCLFPEITITGADHAGIDEEKTATVAVDRATLAGLAGKINDYLAERGDDTWEE
jgi:hypothetical protein